MSDRFSRALVRIVVANILSSIGYDSTEQSALECLTEIMIKFVEEVAYGAVLYTEIAGRSEPNAHDVMMSLNDNGILLSNLIEFKRSFADLTNIQLPIQEIEFPIKSRKRRKTIKEEEDQKPLPEYIPKFFPPFPPSHTYVNTPAPCVVTDSGLANPIERRKLRNQRKRQVEESLTRMVVEESKLQFERNEGGNIEEGSTDMQRTGLRPEDHTNTVVMLSYDAPMQLVNEPPPAPFTPFVQSGVINPYLAPISGNKSGKNGNNSGNNANIVSVKPQARHVRYMDDETEQGMKQERIAVEDKHERQKKEKKLLAILDRPQNIKIVHPPPSLDPN